MKLSANFLSAFFEVAKTKHFAKAADSLAITPSAISQRISLLEQELNVTLFVRDRSGAHLTESGELLLRYCQINSSLEAEVLSQLSSTSSALAGVIRIGGFSSVLRSVIIPALAPFLRDNPQICCEFQSYEMTELPDVLKRAEADIIALDYLWLKSDIEQVKIGVEEYVVIESTKHDVSNDVYLDHGPKDNATESFFASQKRPPKAYRRNFMGDVYGIIDGVELGLGRAVMSKHLLKGNSRVRLVNGYAKSTRNLGLHFFKQAFYSRLHQAIVAQLKKNAGEFLQ